MHYTWAWMLGGAVFLTLAMQSRYRVPLLLIGGATVFWILR